jgi:hypothetical protein
LAGGYSTWERGELKGAGLSESSDGKESHADNGFEHVHDEGMILKRVMKSKALEDEDIS